MISNSGESAELKNIIQYANRNKNIILIGIVSKKNSLLYKNSDLKIDNNMNDKKLNKILKLIYENKKFLRMLENAK